MSRLLLAPVVMMCAVGMASPTLLSAEDKDKDSDVRYKSPRRIRLGGVMVGVAYTGGGGYFPYAGRWAGYPFWGLYDPFWYSAWMHPGLYTGFGQGPSMGQVKLSSPTKEASVYLDGAYAGPLDKLKSMWLEPGVYNIEVRDYGGRSFEKRVYVLTGKTLELRANLNEKEQNQP